MSVTDKVKHFPYFLSREVVKEKINNLAKSYDSISRRLSNDNDRLLSAIFTPDLCKKEDVLVKYYNAAVEVVYESLSGIRIVSVGRERIYLAGNYYTINLDHEGSRLSLYSIYATNSADYWKCDHITQLPQIKEHIIKQTFEACNKCLTPQEKADIAELILADPDAYAHLRGVII